MQKTIENILYENLAYAVIVQALVDYKKALYHIEKNKANLYDFKTVYEVERFFNSESPFIHLIFQKSDPKKYIIKARELILQGKFTKKKEEKTNGVL